MGLTEYRRKRHFQQTPEPVGKRSRKGGHSFVVQKHAASRLHYDFRLELDGVLKSWAVPKGPSLDPTVKRLAMQVEDHPIEYGEFEGVIPQGEYGGGTVLLWDRGEWEPVGDAHEGYRQGRLKFRLRGEKLRGAWMLVRTGGRSPERDERQWLLFKERDAEARPMDQGDILQEMPLSVRTGRDLEETATDRDWVWNSQSTSSGKVRPPRKSAMAARRFQAAAQAKRQAERSLNNVAGSKKAKMPAKVEIELATLTKQAPHGDQWLHEIKFDGYRMICRIDHGRVRLLSRNHKDWTDRLKAIAEAAKKLPVTTAILDGEVVALRPDGTSNFQDLQNAFQENRADQLHYYAFDVLHLDGFDLTKVVLEDRKRLLARLLTKSALPSSLHLSDHIAGHGAEFFKEVCKMGLEGIISKRRDRPYRAGRGYDWLKVKCAESAEFVIGGYSAPSGTRKGFGALLVGYHDADGRLLYAGRVGTGFDDRTLESLLERLQPLRRDHSRFDDFNSRSHKNRWRSGESGKACWVEPSLVAQVRFSGWTRDGVLRHPAFQGLREDKPAAAVILERPVSAAAVAREQKASRGSTRRATKNDMTPPSTSVYNARTEQFAGVRLTSPEKVLYPEQGITKLELATYYQAVSDWILPHLADRPIVLVRCPEGLEKQCFYQKHPAVGTPGNLRHIPIREEEKTEQYFLVDDVGGLISLAQMGALEIHSWGSRADKLELPDRLVFDLDPDPAVPWNRVVQSAQQLRQFLQALGLKSFAKTTGGKGLHLVVPIERRHAWDEVKSFCKRVADLVVRADPTHYTANMAKAARLGKIFIDYLRNARGATAVVAYSTRAHPNATVSVPLTWKELTPETTSDRYTIRNLPRRLAGLKRDPWEGIAEIRQGLAIPLKKLETLAEL
jgi:bifunctional non-homologous end joining protein LigD